MQIDRWHTYDEQANEEPSESAPHHPLRPRASLLLDPRVSHATSAPTKKLKEQGVIPNPSTPIPARASAHAAIRQMRTRHTAKLEQEHDLTSSPTMPPSSVSQRHRGGDYLVESSVPSLSLTRQRAIALDTLDTIPPPLSPTLDELDTIPPLSPSIDELDTIPPLSPSIDELDTIPPLSPTLDKLDTVPPQLSPALDELDTVPPLRRKTTTARNDAAPLAQHKGVSAPLPTVSIKQDTEAGVSWTTAQGKDSWLAQRVASRKKDSKKHSRSLNPVERLRWWLLYPGRIEFLLWFNGAIVLFVVTFFLLFAMSLSLGWLHTGGVTNSNANVVRASQVSKPRLVQTPCTTTNAKNSQCHATTASSSGLQLTLVDNTVLYAGTPIYLRGQGFSANGTVALTYDAQLPCQPNITQTDGHGTFSLSLVLGADAQVGKHQIHALDMASSHVIAVTVDIAPTPPSKLVAPTNGPPGPVATVAAAPTTGGGHSGSSKPIEQTPVPVAPTVGVSPTPASTPTVAVSPSPTTGATPTASVTGTPIVTKKSTDPYLVLRNTLYSTDTNGHFSLNPWLWVAIVGYMLSMTMLGLAGLLYRRKRRLPSQ